jgi:hypothetical protein
MVKRIIFLEDHCKMFDRCLVLLAVLLREEEEEPIVVAIAEPPKNEYELITSTNKLVENLLICYYRSTPASFLLS